jgi:hypothetical protein
MNISMPIELSGLIQGLPGPRSRVDFGRISCPWNGSGISVFLGGER